jgi:RNase P subunit RPR2
VKKCSYCGRANDDAAIACSDCGTPMEEADTSPAQVRSTKTSCPKCGAVDNYRPAVALRSSFNLGTFLLGGIWAVMLRNAGSSRRVICSHCDALFDIQTPGSKLSNVLFWLLISPVIFAIGFAFLALIRALLSHG